MLIIISDARLTVTTFSQNFIMLSRRQQHLPPISSSEVAHPRKINFFLAKRTMYTLKLYARTQLLLFCGEISHITTPGSQEPSVEPKVNDSQE